jgi:hypothetical protein
MNLITLKAFLDLAEILDERGMLSRREAAFVQALGGKSLRWLLEQLEQLERALPQQGLEAILYRMGTEGYEIDELHEGSWLTTIRNGDEKYEGVGFTEEMSIARAMAEAGIDVSLALKNELTEAMREERELPGGFHIAGFWVGPMFEADPTDDTKSIIVTMAHVTIRRIDATYAEWFMYAGYGEIDALLGVLDCVRGEAEPFATGLTGGVFRNGEPIEEDET